MYWWKRSLGSVPAAAASSQRPGSSSASAMSAASTAGGATCGEDGGRGRAVHARVGGLCHGAAIRHACTLACH